MHQTITTTPAASRGRGRAPQRALAALLAVAALLVLASTASALTVTSFTTSSSTTVAGSHPDVNTTFTLEADGTGLPTASLRNIHIQMPAGLIGDPMAVPQCSRAQWTASQCPPKSQVGAGTFTAFLGFPLDLTGKVFNLKPGANEAGLLGIDLGLAKVTVSVSPRSDGDYGLTTISDEAVDLFRISKVSLTLWGVPADHLNTTPRVPFMTAPTTCDHDLTTVLEVDSYQDPGHYAHEEFPTPKATGCDTLPFDPSVSVTPETSRAGAAAGVQVDLVVPQNRNPDGQAAAQVRKTVVTLPKGVTMNPSAANGLTTCTDDQLRLHSLAAATCPAASSIGDVTLDVPILREPVTGHIYLAQPDPAQKDDPEHKDDLFRLFLVARGGGTQVKLAGSVKLGDAGRMVTTFDDTPQVPFERFSLRFRGGDRAILALPPTCGTKTTTATLTTWSGVEKTISSSFDVTGCPAQGSFSPGFVAGGRSNQAGGDTGFSMTLSRDDSQPALGGLKVSLPPGLLGRLAAVPMCPAAQAASGSCGPESRIGTATTAAGAGGTPFDMAGAVYLSQPYRAGDVAAMTIVTPAKAGPIDLGTIVVHAGLRVRPGDAGLDIESEPIPAVAGGFPLRIRQIAIDVDRTGFMFNPTSCRPRAVAATLSAIDGGETSLSSPFQVDGCARLAYRPTMTITAGGKGHTAKGQTTGLTAVLTQPAGQANTSVVAMTLPKAFTANPAPVKAACSQEDLAANRCSPKAQVGRATAVTPVLPAPLTGPVYLVTVPGQALPELVAKFGGPIALNLEGKLSIARGGRIQTTFGKVPDVPISRFELELAGGTNGALKATEDLCKAKPAARLALVAHNGAETRASRAIRVTGCSRSTKRSG